MTGVSTAEGIRPKFLRLSKAAVHFDVSRSKMYEMAEQELADAIVMIGGMKHIDIDRAEQILLSRKPGRPPGSGMAAEAVESRGIGVEGVE